MSVETVSHFEGYNIETALYLLGPADRGDAISQRCCDHLSLLIQNIVTVIFRVLNYLFGDHQWYNNQTARQILQEYNRGITENQLQPIDETLMQQMIALYDALSLRANDNGSYINGIQRPVLPERDLSQEEIFNNTKVAADQGDAEAQFNLGIYYRNGVGTAPNAEEAFRYMKLAADQGHAGAQENLEIHWSHRVS
jgi:hypothetical protein